MELTARKYRRAGIGIIAAVAIALGLISFASAQWEPDHYLPGCDRLGCPTYYYQGHEAWSTSTSSVVLGNSVPQVYSNQYQALKMIYFQTGGAGQPSYYRPNCDSFSCW